MSSTTSNMHGAEARTGPCTSPVTGLSQWLLGRAGMYREQVPNPSHQPKQRHLLERPACPTLSRPLGHIPEVTWSVQSGPGTSAQLLDSGTGVTIRPRLFSPCRQRVRTTLTPTPQVVKGPLVVLHNTPGTVPLVSCQGVTGTSLVLAVNINPPMGNRNCSRLPVTPPHHSTLSCSHMFGAQGSPQDPREPPPVLPGLRQQQAGISTATSAQNQSKNFFERRNFDRSQESAPDKLLQSCTRTRGGCWAGTWSSSTWWIRSSRLLPLICG